MLCGDGARSWDSGRRADVVGGPWDASLVVPGLERRPRRGPDACSMAWRCGPRAARCGPRGRAGASRGRRARVPARGSRHTHTASPRSRRCRDAVFMITRGVHASRESGSRRWRRHETTPPRRRRRGLASVVSRIAGARLCVISGPVLSRVVVGARPGHASPAKCEVARDAAVLATVDGQRRHASSEVPPARATGRTARRPEAADAETATQQRCRGQEARVTNGVEINVTAPDARSVAAVAAASVARHAIDAAHARRRCWFITARPSQDGRAVAET